LNVWNYLNAMPVASPLENIQFVKEFQQAEVYTHASWSRGVKISQFDC
jgi:hypothetical protein